MNNISEAFNGRILEAKELPIISMFEWIKVYLMTRFAKSKLLVKYKGKSKICQKARESSTKRFWPNWNPLQVYALVINPIKGEQLWQASGFPPIRPPHCRVHIERTRRREKDESPKSNMLRSSQATITS
ncbi:hypothetical protein CR513_26620, partial [Mucuna pruriens]